VDQLAERLNAIALGLAATIEGHERGDRRKPGGAITPKRR